MKSYASMAVAALLSLGHVHGATDEYKWSYLSNGADWPLIKAEGTECHLTNQSPIDLRTMDNSVPFPKANGQEFTSSYTNWAEAIVKNLGATIQVNIPEDVDEDNYFNSGYAKDSLGTEATFNSAQFHFHAQSEHTINGKRFDFEMHTVHLPDKTEGSSLPIKASALGLIFDRVHFDKTITTSEREAIDAFFDSLNLENIPNGKAAGHVLDNNATIPFGNLMKIVDTSSRWVYTGSLTTPPCTVGVYFQVVDRVLPISKKHYNLYIKQQRQTNQTEYTLRDGNSYKVESLAEPVTLDVTGNWRVTQKIDNHNVTYMRPDMPGDQKLRYQQTMLIVGIILAVFVLLSIVLAFVARNYLKLIAQKQKEEPEPPLSAKKLIPETSVKDQESAEPKKDDAAA